MKGLDNLKDKSNYTPKNNHEWFLHSLFTDPEFLQEKREILADLKTLVGNDMFGLMFLLMPTQSLVGQLKQRSKKQTARVIAHLRPDDPKLQFNYESDEMKLVRRICELAVHFVMPVPVIEQGLSYNDMIAERVMRAAPTAFIEDGEVIVHVTPTTRLTDLKRLYPHIQELQSQLPGYQQRNRAKVRPDLIYAIYKQRIAGLTFRQIYNLYEKGNLPGYSGPASITGEDNLERNYNRFKPDI